MSLIYASLALQYLYTQSLRKCSPSVSVRLFSNSYFVILLFRQKRKLINEHFNKPGNINVERSISCSHADMNIAWVYNRCGDAAQMWVCVVCVYGVCVCVVHLLVWIINRTKCTMCACFSYINLCNLT